MTFDETTELGHLLERHQRVLEADARGVFAAADLLTPAKERRMVQLGLQAHRELPTGETEIARKMRVDGEWEDRLIAVEKTLERIALAAAGAAAAELPDLLAAALSRR